MKVKFMSFPNYSHSQPSTVDGLVNVKIRNKTSSSRKGGIFHDYKSDSLQ